MDHGGEDIGVVSALDTTVAACDQPALSANRGAKLVLLDLVDPLQRNKIARRYAVGQRAWHVSATGLVRKELVAHGIQPDLPVRAANSLSVMAGLTALEADKGESKRKQTRGRCCSGAEKSSGAGSGIHRANSPVLALHERRS